MPKLTRAGFLARKPKPTPFTSPALGDFYITPMNGLDREKYEQATIDADECQIRATLVMLAVTDENGARIFGDDDLVAINKVEARAIIPIYDRALAVCKIDEASVEALAGN